MSEARSGGAIRCDDSHGAATGAADWLYLAAAPTFATMALLTGVLGSADALCASATASPLGGMVPMYLLMSAFHAGPWLKLVVGKPGAGGIARPFAGGRRPIHIPPHVCDEMR